MRERNPAFLCFALCHRTVGRRLLLSSLMLSCDLIALSDELLLSCVDKSLRTCVMLAGTSKAIRAKLSYEAKARGLRLMCYSAYGCMMPCALSSTCAATSTPMRSSSPSGPGRSRRH